MAKDFDISELTNYEKKLIKLAEQTMPKESKKFLKNEGTKLKKKTLAKAKEKVKKDTGNYFKSIKRGKVYKYNGELSIRAYSNSRHSHLIENGHRIVTKDGEEKGFKEGEHVFEEAKNQFENEYFNDVQDFIDKVLDKGL